MVKKKKRATEYDFTLLSAALSLSPSSIASILFKDGIAAIRESSQMCKDIKKKRKERHLNKVFELKTLLPGSLSSVHNHLDIK